MNSIKRSINYLWNNKKSFLVQLLIFSVIFTFIISGLIIFSGADNYVKTLEKSTKDCVTISGTEMRIKVSGGTTFGKVDIPYEKISEYLDNEHVLFANYSYACSLTFDERYNVIPKERSITSYEINSPDQRAELYTTINTKYDSAFTSMGYDLVEGRHLDKTDAHKQICLISQKFADLNNLKIGDMIYPDVIYYPSHANIKFELEIVGLFTGPDGEYAIGYGNSPDEIIMMPTEAFCDLRKEAGISLDRYSLFNISVYLDSSESIEEYIDFLKENFNVRMVSDNRYDTSVKPVPEEAKELDVNELLEFYFNGRYVDVYTDSQWYDVVAGPIEKVRDLSRFLLIISISVALIILVLLCTIFTRRRKREFGILLSMGEKKTNIILQVCLETIITISISAVVGLALAIFVGTPAITSYMDAAYTGQANIDQQENAISGLEYISETDPIDKGYNHSAYIDLLFKIPTRITVAPNIRPEYSAADMIFVAIIGVIIALISVLIQALYIVNVKPVKLLVRRK